MLRPVALQQSVLADKGNSHDADPVPVGTKESASAAGNRAWSAALGPEPSGEERVSRAETTRGKESANSRDIAFMSLYSC